MHRMTRISKLGCARDYKLGYRRFRLPSSVFVASNLNRLLLGLRRASAARAGIRAPSRDSRLCRRHRLLHFRIMSANFVCILQTAKDVEPIHASPLFTTTPSTMLFCLRKMTQQGSTDGS